MTSFTFSAEQVKSAPPEVRHWIENEIVKALALPSHIPQESQKAHENALAACSPSSRGANGSGFAGPMTRSATKPSRIRLRLLEGFAPLARAALCLIASQKNLNPSVMKLLS